MDKLTRLLKSRFIEHMELRTDAARAVRALVAFTVPFSVFHWLQHPTEAAFVSTAAMNLSLPDLRGAYHVRLGVLLCMILVAAGSAFLGGSCAENTILAVLAMGVLAALGGVWRHLSADYGPSMSVSSALLFLLSLSQSGGESTALHLAGLTALGGAFATFLHGITWVFRPQHALRSAVAETWVATSDLLAAMRPGATEDQNSKDRLVAGRERELRATLDRTFVILGEAEKMKPTALLTHLEEVRREAVHLTMRAIALNTSLESCLSRPEFDRFVPVLDSVLKTLSDAARSVAITLIQHRPENLSASKIRLRRSQHLIKAFDAQITAARIENADMGQMRAALAKVGEILPRIFTVLSENTDHSSVQTMFPIVLPDISTYSIRSLGAWARPVNQLDPTLVRHALRMAAFTMAAVAIYKGFGIPRGYWIAFTIVVVLQPDYGSTRQRALHRIGGTVGGCLLAGGLLSMKIPSFVLDVLAAAAAFGFAYVLRRRYWLAIFLVTINLVLVMESLSTLRNDVMVMRVVSTLLGGTLALVAARLFWPVWEGKKFPPLLAAALRANRSFLDSIFPLEARPAGAAPNLLMARRRAENANRYVAASLERLLGEPSGFQENPERAAALVTYCQRITRALNLLAVQAPAAGSLQNPAVAGVLKSTGDLLDRMAQVVESGCEEPAVDTLTGELEKLEAGFGRANILAAHGSEIMNSPTGLAGVQIAKTIAELRAMTLALKMQPTAVVDLPGG